LEFKGPDAKKGRMQVFSTAVGYILFLLFPSFSLFLFAMTYYTPVPRKRLNITQNESPVGYVGSIHLGVPSLGLQYDRRMGLFGLGTS
jgi:hypothetical protein